MAVRAGLTRRGCFDVDALSDADAFSAKCLYVVVEMTPIIRIRVHIYIE